MGQSLAVRAMPVMVPYSKADQGDSADKPGQSQQRPGLGGIRHQTGRGLCQGDREREGDGCRAQDVRCTTRPPSDPPPRPGRHCPPTDAETAGFGAGCCAAESSPNPKT